jgi:hypothetical protein
MPDKARSYASMKKASMKRAAMPMDKRKYPK